MRRLALLLPLFGALFAIPACGQDKDDPGKVGDKIITVYSGRGESLVKAVYEKFEKKTGIDVRVRYGNTAQLAAQLTEEGGKSPADVFFAQDAGALGAVAKAGLFSPLPAATRQAVPATYQSKSGEWVGVSGRVRVLAYNSELLPAGGLPKSALDLTQPRWRGKLGVAPTNASFQAFITAVRLKHGDDAARKYLADLKANDPQIRDSNVRIVADVNDGKIPAGLVNHYYIYELAKEKGIPADQLKVKLHFFDGGDVGGLVNAAGVGIMKKAAADPDAQALVDYLLSVEGQTHFAQHTHEYPLVAGVPAAAGLPPLDKLSPPKIDLNDLDSLSATVAMIKESGLA